MHTRCNGVVLRDAITCVFADGDVNKILHHLQEQSWSWKEVCIVHGNQYTKAASKVQMFQDSSAHFMMKINNIAFMLLIFASIKAKHITSILMVNASACINHFEDGKSWKPRRLFVTEYSCN